MPPPPRPRPSRVITSPNRKIVVVTGGCGYIGSHAAAELLRRTRHRVVLVDNLSRGRRATVGRIAAAAGRPAEFARADLRDPLDLRRALAHLDRVDAVLHLAALKSVPESVARPGDYYANNVGGMVNLLAWMRERGCRRVVYSSSCAVYGEVPAGGGPVDEEQPPGPPASPYAHTKQLGERLLALAPDLRAVALRYFNPAGADDSGHLRDDGGEGLASVLCQAAARGLPVRVFGDDYPTPDGTCVRDYVHVVDVARAHVAALGWALGEATPAREVVNLGAGRGASVREAIAAFERASGIALDVRRAPRRPGDVAAIAADCSRAAALLGWRAERDLDAVMASAWRAAGAAAAGAPIPRAAATT